MRRNLTLIRRFSTNTPKAEATEESGGFLLMGVLGATLGAAGGSALTIHQQANVIQRTDPVTGEVTSISCDNVKVPDVVFTGALCSVAGGLIGGLWPVILPIGVVGVGIPVAVWHTREYWHPGFRKGRLLRNRIEKD